MSEIDLPVSLPIEAEQILELLPHRYPFLLVDRVTELEPGKTLVATKNVTINEPFFQGHFPGHPVMPGVLIVEAMAQAAGLLTRFSHQVPASQRMAMFYLVKVDKARFSAVVVPGDQLRITVSLKRQLRGMGLFEAAVHVDGKEVASCEIMCASRSDK